MTRFDFYMRSRSTLELKRRCEVLLKAIVKEYEESKREANGSMNAHSDGQNAVKPQTIKKRRSTTADNANTSKKAKTTKS